MTRLIQFDIAKAIAIILVVVGHYFPDNAPHWYAQLRSWIYTFHMPLFMFLSGYIYLAFKKQEPYGLFIQKKVHRLLVPYFAASAIIISIKLISQQYLFVENPVSYSSFLKIFFKPEAGYFLWFIWSLFTFFLIIPFFRTIKARNVLFIFAIILHYTNPTTHISLFAINETSKNMIWFMLGIFSCDYKSIVHAQTWEKHKSLFKVLILTVFSLASTLFYLNNTCATYILPWTGIFSTIIVATWITRCQGKLTTFLIAIGSSSYVIYLFHTTFEGFAKALIYKTSLSSTNLGFIASVLICTAIGIICPILLYKFVISKFRITRFLFGLK
jgi:fucose 4-O-acetylase-like acetyltransferase